MWFGDLVTMEWWDDLWLNESFASLDGHKAVDHLFRDWHMWTQFIYEDTNVGLTWTAFGPPIPSKPRCEIRPRSESCSMPSATEKGLPSCTCWRSCWVPRRSVTTSRLPRRPPVCQRPD